MKFVRLECNFEFYLCQTHLCNTVLDRHELEGDTSADVLRDLVGALESDTLLFRADSPPELAPFLAASWDPLLAWFSTRSASSCLHSLGLS